MSNTVGRSFALAVALLMAMRVLPATAGQSAAPPALSEAQIAAIKAIQGEAEQKAAPAALRLAAVVSRLYDNNLSDTPVHGESQDS